MLSFDDVSGLVYFTRPGLTKVTHVSKCDWIEFENQIPLPSREGAKK